MAYFHLHQRILNLVHPQIQVPFPDPSTISPK
uniref:Uncharacterized protein n=1 Tax=Rhizophora mucronata TaxID=61149 RepID=A0A2P2PEF4_RHIMU